MRKDIEVDTFPYNIKSNSLNCYFIIRENNEIEQFGRNKSNINRNIMLFNELLEGKAKAYATWAGRWRTDLFEITDINRFFNENL